MELRPYQSEAVTAVLNEWKEHQRTLLVLPTGCGKTIVFAAITKNLIDKNERVLILAHRGELLEQASDKMRRAFGVETALEKAESTAVQSDLPAVVGSVQTLSNAKRLEQYPPDHFTTIIIDEAHHALSDSYQQVLQYFSQAKVLGVTATPDRGDHRNLAGYFESKAYEYPIARAIKEGYLSRVVAKMIPLQIDLSKVAITEGDYSAGQAGAAIEPYLEQIAYEMAKICMYRKTVVFTPLVRISEKFVDILRAWGFRAAEVNGNSFNREKILKDFAEGRYNVLCNSMLLTEGWDCPSVDCVVVLRPTKVRALYQQMVGRGMRLHPGKENLLLLDFLWLVEKHDLCRPSALFAKDEEKKKAIDKLVEQGEEIDIMDAEEQAEADAVKLREEKLAKELAEQRRKKAKTIDPFQYAFAIADDNLVDYEPVYAWEREAVTENQKGALEKMGINPDAIDCKGLAAAVLTAAINRSKAGLASPKQIKVLERYGFQHVANWQKEDAKKIMGVIARNSWHVPPYINPAEYQPKGGKR